MQPPRNEPFLIILHIVKINSIKPVRLSVSNIYGKNVDNFHLVPQLAYARPGD